MKRLVTYSGCFLIILAIGFLFFQQNSIKSLYLHRKNNELIQKTRIELDKLDKEYRQSDLTTGILILKRMAEKTNFIIKNIDEKVGPISYSKELWCADLCIIFGRLSVKYKEVGDLYLSEKYLEKAKKIRDKNKYLSGKMNDINKFIQKLDTKTNSETGVKGS